MSTFPWGSGGEGGGHPNEGTEGTSTREAQRRAPSEQHPGPPKVGSLSQSRGGFCGAAVGGAERGWCRLGRSKCGRGGAKGQTGAAGAGLAVPLSGGRDFPPPAAGSKRAAITVVQLKPELPTRGRSWTDGSESFTQYSHFWVP